MPMRVGHRSVDSTVGWDVGRGVGRWELGIGNWELKARESVPIDRPELPYPDPVNEPNLTYLPGSPEREALKARLASMASERIDIPIIIGGCEIRTGSWKHAVMPHDHGHVLADWHRAEPQHVEQAIAAAAKARPRMGRRRRWRIAPPSSCGPRSC